MGFLSFPNDIIAIAVIFGSLLIKIACIVYPYASSSTLTHSDAINRKCGLAKVQDSDSLVIRFFTCTNPH